MVFRRAEPVQEKKMEPKVKIQREEPKQQEERVNWKKLYTDIEQKYNEIEKKINGILATKSIESNQVKRILSFVNEKIKECNTKKAWGKQYAYKEVLLEIQKIMEEII